MVVYSGCICIQWLYTVVVYSGCIQWLYSGCTVVVQWPYSGRTVAVQWSYSGSTVVAVVVVVVVVVAVVVCDIASRMRMSTHKSSVGKPQIVHGGTTPGISTGIVGTPLGQRGHTVKTVRRGGPKLGLDVQLD